MTEFSQQTMERVELHLPLCPLSAREIWNRQQDRLLTKTTFKRVLDHLVTEGRAGRIGARQPTGTPKYLYWRKGGRPKLDEHLSP